MLSLQKRTAEQAPRDPEYDFRSLTSNHRFSSRPEKPLGIRYRPKRRRNPSPRTDHIHKRHDLSKSDE